MSGSSQAEAGGDGRAYAFGQVFEVLVAHHAAQSSHFNPGTRVKLVVSFVTRVAPKARAWAPISVSSEPMGWPEDSSRCRIAP
jgi:hypothetical protein